MDDEVGEWPIPKEYADRMRVDMIGIWDGEWSGGLLLEITLDDEPFQVTMESGEPERFWIAGSRPTTWHVGRERVIQAVIARYRRRERAGGLLRQLMDGDQSTSGADR